MGASSRGIGKLISPEIWGSLHQAWLKPWAGMDSLSDSFYYIKTKKRIKSLHGLINVEVSNVAPALKYTK